MGFIAPKKGEKLRVVVEWQGPKSKAQVKQYKKALRACLKHHGAKAAIREIVKK